MDFPHFAALRSSQFASGVTYYQDHYPSTPDHSCICVMLDLGQGVLLPAIIDTGAPWCMFDPEYVDLLDAPAISHQTIHLSTRIGTLRGTLHRVELTLHADQGQSLLFETTVFKPLLADGERWLFPNFIGMQNFLDRLRFAVDPSPHVQAFYFGEV